MMSAENAAAAWCLFLCVVSLSLMWVSGRVWAYTAHQKELKRVLDRTHKTHKEIGVTFVREALWVGAAEALSAILGRPLQVWEVADSPTAAAIRKDRGYPECDLATEEGRKKLYQFLVMNAGWDADEPSAHTHVGGPILRVVTVDGESGGVTAPSAVAPVI